MGGVIQKRSLKQVSLPKLDDGTGVILIAKYVVCGAYSDDTDCVEDYIFIGGVKAFKARLLCVAGWTKPKERGWLCPKCSAKWKAKLTREKTQSQKKRESQIVGKTSQTRGTEKP